MSYEQHECGIHALWPDTGVAGVTDWSGRILEQFLIERDLSPVQRTTRGVTARSKRKRFVKSCTKRFRGNVSVPAEPVADELPGLGDTDVDGPFLGADAGEPGPAGRGCHGRAAAEDRDGGGLELGVPARRLPACGPGQGVDPVAGLAAAVVAEDRG